MTFKLPAAADGTVVAGRSMEFPAAMPTQLAALPSNQAGAATVGEGTAPATWAASHGVVGMGVFGRAEWLVDGVNTAGVSPHLLYMPGGHCTYRSPRGDGTDLAQVDLVAYLLGTCASLDEVTAAVAAVNVVSVDPGMGFVPPVHCLILDTTGSVAIEFHPDATVVVDNPVGLATNAPYLDWHLVNLGNYLGMSAQNPPSEVVGGLTIGPLGQGEGLRGIPADYTPPSRFVRLFTVLGLLDQPADAHGAELAALHVCNVFDIPKGLVAEVLGANVVPELTEWDAVINLTTPRYAYRMTDDPTTYVVDLALVDFSWPARLQDLPTSGGFTPVTI